jgi:hypothetical protein
MTTGRHPVLVLLLLLTGLSLGGCGPGSETTERPVDEGDPAGIIGDGPQNGSRAGAMVVGIRSNNGAGDSEEEPICSGDLAADTFRYGLCVCGDLREAGSLETSSFFGSSQDEQSDGLGGGVGVNGDFTVAGNSEIGGTLSVGGEAEIAGNLDIEGELRVAGRFAGAGAVDIGRDAYVQGDIDVVGDVDINGTLHVTDSPGFSSLFIDAEDVSVEDFTIDAPCGCDMADDIQAFIAQAEADNDNEAEGVPTDALSPLVGAEELVLAPGKYVFDSIDTAGALRLVVSGPTAVYVPGGVRLAGALEVDLDGDDASLDLFFGSDFEAAGHLDIGNMDDPERVRLYLAEAADLEVAGHLDLGSAIYAPSSTLRVAGDAELAGAIVIGDVVNAGRLRVRYDADLQGADDACDPGDEPQPDPGDEPEPQPEPGDEPEPQPEPGDEPQPSEDDEGGCTDFQDCPDPQICLDGECVFVSG